MDFQNQLENILASEATQLAGYNKAIAFCQHALSSLKQGFLSNGSLGLKEDIRFFKTTKQQPQIPLFYYWELREYQANYPLSGNAHQKKYINVKLKDVRDFLDRHKGFRKYLSLGHNHFDHLYFTRKGISSADKYQSIGIILESDFYTSHDILLSQIKANELLALFYVNELKDLKNKKSDQITSLKWTGSKVAFVELVYALHHTGVFQQKEIPVKIIARVLAECFQLPPFDIYDTFGDIKRRKKEPAAFLNQMLLAFNQALENANNQV